PFAWASPLALALRNWVAAASEARSAAACALRRSETQSPMSTTIAPIRKMTVAPMTKRMSTWPRSLWALAGDGRPVRGARVGTGLAFLAPDLEAGLRQSDSCRAEWGRRARRYRR